MLKTCKAINFIVLWIYRTIIWSNYNFASHFQLDANSDMSNLEEREMKLFPARDDLGRVTSCDITNEYMLYATDVIYCFALRFNTQQWIE